MNNSEITRRLRPLFSFSPSKGTHAEALAHFSAVSHPIPQYSNPADKFLQLTNVDFSIDEAQAAAAVKTVNEGETDAIDEAPMLRSPSPAFSHTPLPFFSGSTDGS
jgi:hypothetical protein